MLETVVDGRPIYIFDDFSWHLQEIYKPVIDTPPAPTWRDVTGECEVGGSSIFHGKRGSIIDFQGCIKSNYRLRKVQVYERTAVGNEQTLNVAYVPHWAFLVERKL